MFLYNKYIYIYILCGLGSGVSDCSKIDNDTDIQLVRQAFLYSLMLMPSTFLKTRLK